jgi:hypothetical protein
VGGFGEIYAGRFITLNTHLMWRDYWETKM